MAAIDAEPDTDLLNLLASVLTRGIDALLRRGLDRGYLVTAEEIAGIRGKLDVSATLKGNLLTRARTFCQFDELSHDVLHNQILKATLHRLLHSKPLDNDLRKRIRVAYLRLPGIRHIHLSERSFHSVQLHANIRLYRFLIDVSQLLFEHLIPDEETGVFRFRDFTRDEQKMRRLFERFLYNFYKHEQGRFKVNRSRFPWADATTPAPHLLPQMNTDLTLTRPGHQIVIDAKYSTHVLQRHPYGSQTLNSGHLYQMFAYLKNIRKTAGETVDGLIVYPRAQDAVDATISLPGHRLRVCTVDLNQHWKLIRRDLLALVAPPEAFAT
jgi:5-methylcytosine-specific restriction enzyme subunit McrC